MVTGNPLGEFSPVKMREQMTAEKAGVLRDDAEKLSSIDWKEAQREIRRLQVRIAKAVKKPGGPTRAAF